MLLHRFRELLEQPLAPQPTTTGNVAPFVACPAPLAMVMSAAQQAQIAYLYSLAYEHAQAQVAPPRTARLQFSLN
ncbi:MAG TPA: hypothetical protein VKE40_13685 [Gemmataceae bacterium]|nr:hypothetical protein [Gemmataceae bacterium]